MKQTRWASEQAELAEKVASLSEYIQVETDPIEVLLAIRDLRELLRPLEDCAAREAKSNGATWQMLGDALGISRQAAFEKYTVDTYRDYKKMLENIDPDIKARVARVRAAS